MNTSDKVHADNYSVEVDNVNKNEWAELLMQFDDASIYQTWSAGAMLSGEQNLSHIILRKNGELAGLCQVVLRKIGNFITGIADVVRGPLYQITGHEENKETFFRLLSALRDEYAIKKGLLVRLWPSEYDSCQHMVKSAIETVGFKYNAKTPKIRTLRLDLSPTIEELRKNLDQKWRNQLNKAEKNSLSVIEGDSDELFKIFLDLQREMCARKGFVPNINYSSWRLIQNDLQKPLKMKIMICKAQGESVAVAICSAIGNTGRYLFGASGNKGMNLNASNLLQWYMIKWLKESGCSFYDLGGIDPAANASVYHFKRGIAGKMGKDETLMGEFDVHNSVKAFLLKSAIDSSRLLFAKKRK